ncbi:hypothetical protein [uncultured Thiodictyon sp.]|uniref:hypothetical protein n=1 Tax=uncultured Thiodictyon sp. TaxID=1846217 RepID=UPI0025F66CA9|nr:hypothetical protein [uncultured Thiodictyon sp.]
MSIPTLPSRLLLAALCLPAGAVVAEPLGQTHFSSTAAGALRQFDYGWVDRDGNHTLSFQVSVAAIAAARRDFHAWRNADLQQAADAELERQTKRAVDDLGRAYPGVEVELRPDRGIAWRVSPPADLAAQQHARFDEAMDRACADIQSDYPGASVRRGADGHFALSARSKDDLAAIERRLEAAQTAANEDAARLVAQAQGEVEHRSARIGQELDREFAAIKQRMGDFKLAYFRERLYRLDASGVLWPDYARIASRALPNLKPLALALGPQLQGLPLHTALTRAMAFIQTIPYDRLTDRGNDAGFLPPLAMLAENRGDCDTKSVAFAVLAHLLYPQVPSALILVRNHAFLGLGLTPQAGDSSVQYDRRTWVLAEPVGPGVLPVGEIGADSQAALGRIVAVVPLFP